jgi:hypothetical protein
MGDPISISKKAVGQCEYGVGSSKDLISRNFGGWW